MPASLQLFVGYSLLKQLLCGYCPPPPLLLPPSMCVSIPAPQRNVWGLSVAAQGASVAGHALAALPHLLLPRLYLQPRPESWSQSG